MGRRVFTAILPGVSLPPYLSTRYHILNYIIIRKEKKVTMMRSGTPVNTVATVAPDASVNSAFIGIIKHMYCAVHHVWTVYSTCQYYSSSFYCASDGVHMAMCSTSTL